ncbi:MAG: aspartate aminotransferase family protein [Rhodospirillales bacterium]|nr:aspartate aminotransferase family protein [Rhodospirillales bacterium]
MSRFIEDLLRSRGGEKFKLHEQLMNTQMVRVLKTIGFDRHYTRGVGPYLFDEHGDRYLDLLSGWGALALGRNHPVVNGALQEVMEAELPNLVQMDVSPLSGLLAEALLATAPGDGLEKVLFANSGTEAVEAAIKLARYATRRDGLIHCDHGFHGLTMGSLSLNGDATFRNGFGPLLPDCHMVPFDDLEALEAALRRRTAAAFVVEPIQGKGVNIPSDSYLPEAKRLCERYGTVFIADEIQTGLGRTGAMWAVEHWGVEPDMLVTAKALSGGQIPVGAVLSRKRIYNAVFDRMERAVIHGSTFGQNNAAMAAGLATLHVLKEERLVSHAKAMGERLMAAMAPFVERYEFVKDVRGKGLMIALEFGPPQSLKLRASWAMLEKADKSLFSQMVLVPLFAKHRILAQVAGHGMHVIKLLPPLVIDEADVAWTVAAFDDVIADCHKVPGSIWSLGTTLAGHAIAARR